MLNDDEIGGFPILVLRCTSDYTLEKWSLSENGILQDEETKKIDKNDKQKPISYTNEINKNSENSSVDMLSKLSGWETV